MDKHDDNAGLWLHLICCGGPILVFAAIGLAPAVIAFVLTYKIWVLAVGLGLALAGVLVWRGRARRAARLHAAARLDHTQGLPTAACEAPRVGQRQADSTNS